MKGVKRLYNPNDERSWATNGMTDAQKEDYYTLTIKGQYPAQEARDIVMRPKKQIKLGTPPTKK